MGYSEDSHHPVERFETHQTANYDNMTVGEYLGTRVSSLRPPMTKLPNPIRLIRSLSPMQWAFFFVAFAAWVCFVLLLLIRRC